MSHEPKLAALLAHAEGLLSDDGTRRIETHLRGCGVCREALAAIRTYDDALSDLAADPGPEIDFGRMELALRREARTQARALREERAPVGRAMLGAFAVAAAVVLAVFVGRPAEPDVVGVRPPREAPAMPVEAAHRTGTVTARVGTPTLDDVAVHVGAEVHEGGVLASAGGELHVRFDNGTGLLLRGDSTAQLSALRVDEARIELRRGTVSNVVAPLEDGERYSVVAGDYGIEVRGTRFSVSVDDARAVHVDLDEGVVDVMHDGRRVARLVAPSEWSSSDWAPQAATDGPSVAVPTPHGLSAGADAWPIFRVPMSAAITRWEIGDGTFTALGELEMRLPEGPVTVRAFDTDRLVFETVQTVEAAGGILESDALRPSAPPVRVGTLAPELIQPTVQAGVRRMRSCQQNVARQTGQTVVGRFALRITIGLTGDVQNARLSVVHGERPPPVFEQCILQEARSWGFPAPTGGVVTFDAPLRFGTRQ